MKTEIWNGYFIRFIEKGGEWWAVAKDVCDALGLVQVTRAISSLPGVTKSKVSSGGELREVNKADMTPQMLVEREPILDDTVELMSINEKFKLGLSVSNQIYQRCL